MNLNSNSTNLTPEPGVPLTTLRPDYAKSSQGACCAIWRRFRVLAVFGLIVAMVAVGWWGHGRGYKTAALRRLFPHDAAYMRKPKIILVSPANRADSIMPDAYVRAEFTKPNGAGVDPATLNSGSVQLLKGNAREKVEAQVNTDAVGSVIVLRPAKPLEFNALYTFQILPALKDTAGAAFEEFEVSFSTAAGNVYTDYPVAAKKFEQVASLGKWYTGVTFGPDHRLYASTLAGEICRFDIADDGTLFNQQVMTTILARNRGPRICTGVTMDPASTPTNVSVYVAHGIFPFDREPEGQTAKGGGTPHGLSTKTIPDWSGKVSRLSGANLENYQDVIVGLPRARHDHTTGQLTFGPDGALYFGQASNTAMGEPDKEWGFRHERLLTGAILRLDFKKLAGRQLPLDVKTAEGGTYNPFAAEAPLTIFATGTRNSYDLCFHSNGRFYATANGSARGGNTPGTPAGGVSPDRRIDQDSAGAYNGPEVPRLTGVGTQNDYLFKLEKGGYYGHPNPTRSEFVMNGGNPTAGVDPCEVAEYPVGTQPDRNWRRPAFDFNKNLAPCGMIEYTGDAFPLLKGKILCVRFSGGKDIIALTPDDSTGDIRESITGIDGFTHFIDPVDLCQSPKTGYLYVAEHTGKKLTLVKPVAGGVSKQVVRLDVTPPGAPATRPSSSVVRIGQD